MSEQDTQVAETITSDETVVIEETTDDIDNVEALKSNLEKEKTAKNQILARAKKAEAELKALKGSKTEEANQPISTNPLSDEQIDLKILKSQGMGDELLSELHALAKIRNKSIFETQSDPLFVAIKNAREAETKSAKAKLGASKGSGTVKQEKTFTAKGLTPAEHKEMWLKSQGK